jgi:predicted Zn-dependent protease
MSNRILALLIAAALGGTALARDPGEPFRPGMNFFSKEQDVQLGREASQQVRQKYREVQSPFVKDYVQQVGRRLASAPAASDSGFPFAFTVLQDKSINAFALPGGPMFIFSGLVRNVDNEAQLAAVMAHEMAHVILRHGTHQASKANLIKLPVLLAGEALGQRSLLATITNLGANGLILKYSRDAESDADALGAHLMAAAGYDPVQMARFFNKLQSLGGQRNSGLAQFLSDHPNPGNRERAIMAEAQTIRGSRYGYETGQFRRAKSEVGR